MPHIPTLPVLPGTFFTSQSIGVVGVGALVGVFGAVLHRLVRADGDVIALAHEPAADVLVDEDELLAREQFRGPQVRRGTVDAVGRHVVARALHHDRISPAVGEDVLRDVDGGEQLHAVAHGDAVFELGVVLADEGGALGRCGGGIRRGGSGASPLSGNHLGQQYDGEQDAHGADSIAVRIEAGFNRCPVVVH